MRRIGAITLVWLLALAAPMEAQEEGRTLGLGVGLQSAALLTGSDAGILTFLSPQVYIPIAVSDRILLEPSLGLFRVSEEDTFGGQTQKSTTTAFRMGAGVLFTQPAGAAGRVYVGPRVGLIRASSEREGDITDRSESRMDLLLSLVAGGEYFLVPGFSLGGEVGLEWVRIGDEDITPDPAFEVEQDMSLLRTVTGVRVRWYLK